MTNEQAINWLVAIKEKYIHGGDEGFDELRKEALDKAVKALEEERPRGEWIETNSNDENIICPFCKTEFNGDIKLICGGENPNFCPNCGAKMKGGVA